MSQILTHTMSRMVPCQHLPFLFILFICLVRPGSGITDAIAQKAQVCAMVGEDGTLSCHLFPPTNAEDMQITWTRESEDNSTVHYYSKGKEYQEKQDAKYKGRTTMIRKDLANGVAVVTIRNLTRSDAGQYFCSFHSSTSPLQTSDGVKLRVVGRSACDLETELERIIQERDALVKERDYLQRFKDFQPKDSEWRWARNFAEPITMDANTAHRRLVISEDRRSVIQLEESEQDLPDTPARYDKSPCVLGVERFTAGSHYWEVEVGNVWWEIGVCDESVSRKGRAAPSPGKGCWVVGLWGEQGYRAFTRFRTPLTPTPPPKTLGLFLDYEAGRVSFYDVDKKSKFFSFPPVSFPHTLLPYFCTYDHVTHLRLRQLEGQI